MDAVLSSKPVPLKPRPGRKATLREIRETRNDAGELMDRVVYSMCTGQPHSFDDAPACVLYDYRVAKDWVKCELWYTHGKLDRDVGPAVVSYFPCGKVHEELYFRDGLMDREKYPAHIIHEQGSRRVTRVWYREGGPLRRDVRENYDPVRDALTY